MNRLFVEKYRPVKLSDIKGQDKIVERVKAMVKNKNLSNLLLAGPPGVGKTSMILAAAMELYGKSWRANIMETNASMDRGINIVREQIKDFARTKSISDAPFKICVLDEADSLTKEAQQALRRTMEQYSDSCRFCLLANFPSKIIEPIQSRCSVFRFKPLEKKDADGIIKEICKKEGLKIDEKAIDAIYNASEGDVRKAINILQSSSSAKGNITEKLVYETESIANPKEVKNILDIALKGDFLKARDKLLEVMVENGLSGLDIIKQIQKEIWNLEISQEEKVKLVDKCGEIEFRMVEGSDEYVQLESLLANFVGKK